MIIFFLLGAYQGFSQTPRDFAVELSAEIQETPSRITLQWPSTNASQIKIYRKIDKNNKTFSIPVATIAGSETQYVDNSVEIGQEYEYRVEKEYSNYSANGYILSGIKVSPKESRGSIVLLVESSKAIPLQQELKTLEEDLMGDGWMVIRHNIPVSDAPPQVKNRIVQDYNSAPNEVKAVLIVGHIAVPYSGLIVPDGHPPDHLGAWPADAYYGDMNGTWTDSSVNNTGALDQRNHNVPGDGKFDQSVLPSDIELQVGRVDFHDLPVFSQSETELLRKYLNKNHAFRNKLFTASARGLIDDNFGDGRLESFSSSLYRSFNVMFGADNVDDKDYFTTMANESYLWSHGNGGGYYDRANGVGDSQDFANIEVKSVFTTLFGSWHGDWDSRNNFMRSSLASGTILTCAWSGIPQWQFHQMALGENIGLCAKNTSNAFEYELNFYDSKSVHVSLLGDPTLRMHIIAPPTTLQITENGSAELSWAASNEGNLLGYHVYLKIDNENSFQRLTTDLVVNTSYTSPITTAGLHTYMVRAVKLEENPSGSYYNLSQGIFAEIQLGEPEPEILIADAGADKTITCSVQTVELGGSNTSTGATYNWSTADGTFVSGTDQMIVTVSAPGTYVLTVMEEDSVIAADEVVVEENREEPSIELGDSVTIETGASVNIGVETLSDYTYAWEPDITLSDDSISDPIVSPSSTTTYTLKVTGPNGCTSEDSITVQVEEAVAEGEGEMEGENIETGKIVLYPNPASEVIHIQSDSEIEAIAITDMTDKTILKPTSKDIDVSMLRSGVYLIHFIVDGKLFVRNFIKR